jgi:hypothetical protein
MTALNHTIFQFLKEYLSSKVKSVSKKMRFQSFVKKFMPIATSWMNNKLMFHEKQREFEELSQALEFDTG